MKIIVLLRITNGILLITLYKIFGIDWVIVYTAINLDAHLDEIALRINKKLLRK